MKVVSIVNSASGSVPNNGIEQLASNLAQQSKIDCVELVEFDPIAIGPALDEAIRQDIEAVIVWGGDGSIACVANQLQPSSIPILPLPGGTMNLLHRRVHGGEFNWEDCLAALSNTNEPYEIIPGELNGHRFYVAAMFGALTKLAKAREAVRKGNHWKAASTILQGDSLDMSSQLQFKFPQKRHEGCETVVAVAAFVTDDETQPLKVGVIDPDNLLDLTSVGLDAILNGWEDAETVDKYFGRSLDVEHVDGEVLTYTLDGERCESDQPVHVRIAKTPVRFLSLRNM